MTGLSTWNTTEFQQNHQNKLKVWIILDITNGKVLHEDSQKTLLKEKGPNSHKYKVSIKITVSLFIKSKCNKGNFEEQQCVEVTDIPDIKPY